MRHLGPWALHLLETSRQAQGHALANAILARGFSHPAIGFTSTAVGFARPAIGSIHSVSTKPQKHQAGENTEPGVKDQILQLALPFFTVYLRV